MYNLNENKSRNSSTSDLSSTWYFKDIVVTIYIVTIKLNFHKSLFRINMLVMGFVKIIIYRIVITTGRNPYVY